MTYSDPIPDLPDFLDRRKQQPVAQQKPFVWTYTNLHIYDDVCPYQFFRTYLKKDIPYVAMPEMDWGNQVHSAMELRVGAKKPLPENMRHWEQFAAPFASMNVRVEVKLGITREGKPTGFFDKDVAGRGKADVVLVDADRAHIADWKTGGSKYENAFELRLHGLMLKAAMPYLTRITGNFIWLKENSIGQLYDLSDFGGTWAQVNNIVEKIEDNMIDGEWEKRRGPLCSWCRVFDCENNSNPKR